MKILLFLSLIFLHCTFGFAQSDSKYAFYASKITSFSKPFRILSQNVDAVGNGTVEFTNAKKQILRFRLYNHKVKEALCKIAFEIFYYEKNYLKKIESLDINGNLIGCNLKQYGEAITEFIIEKPGLYLKKKKLIDDAEGNIDMKDDSKEKIIRIKLFDVNNLQIIQKEPAYISSKTYYDNSNRMYWP
ncbi:hypothetical protein IRZ71_08435 [Flavobacterium sp. ANB]|uniref:hypothetical protein n=1 Tax=unclassified Flavobacterium TaxID=196869 RepID=UPI0012B9B001|nr:MULTISPECIES: hypothetical protein [unclassified Flavobacterium]MBF4516367.1 hypothetical protein [Flavobacterium sp. ANB]MTD69736.1 hypothetical protein [Flavobacterium sp. LC2016-13]